MIQWNSIFLQRGKESWRGVKVICRIGHYCFNDAIWISWSCLSAANFVCCTGAGGPLCLVVRRQLIGPRGALEPRFRARYLITSWSWVENSPATNLLRSCCASTGITDLCRGGMVSPANPNFESLDKSVITHSLRLVCYRSLCNIIIPRLQSMEGQDLQTDSWPHLNRCEESSSLLRDDVWSSAVFEFQGQDYCYRL